MIVTILEKVCSDIDSFNFDNFSMTLENRMGKELKRSLNRD